MSQSAGAPKSGHLAETLATWIYLLHDSGRLAEDADVRAACVALAAAGVELHEGGGDVDQHGHALVSVVERGLDAAGGRSFDAVLGWLRRLYGEPHVATEVGDDRDARIRAARAYQFGTNLPWLARIIDRFPDGTVGPHWVMVERVTDVVTCMDPYPWDDLDEEYQAPVNDFMVKWELAGCDGVRWVA